MTQTKLLEEKQNKQIMNPSQQQTLMIKVMISYLYLIQGMIISLTFTFPLTYQKIPSYSIMSLFSLSIMPFSFKFISAILIEKYTSQKYGRRKTWIVFPQFMVGILLLLLSYQSNEQHQLYAIATLLMINFGLSLQDITVDALIIQSLKCPQTATFIQILYFGLGTIFGRTLFIQLTSNNTLLGSMVGVNGNILSVLSFLQIISLIFIIPTIFIHIFYQQKSNHQLIGQQVGLLMVVKRYKEFVNVSYVLCRQLIGFVVLSHSLNYFNSSFHIELIKNYGFSRQLRTTLMDICIIPSMTIIYIFKQLIKQKVNKSQQLMTRVGKLHKYQHIVFTMRCLSTILMFMLMDYIASSVLLSSICLVIINLFFVVQNFTNGSLINTLSMNSKYVAMYTTMLISISNLSKNSSVNLQIIEYVGFNNGCKIGIILSILSMMYYGRVCQWVRDGQRSDNKVDKLE